MRRVKLDRMRTTAPPSPSPRLTALAAALLLSAACEQKRPAITPLKPAPTTMPAVDLGPGGATVLRLLEQVSDATLNFPGSSLPEHAGEPGVFSLDDGWKRMESGH